MQPSTFSIVAIDRDTGELGIAVESKFLSVGALVPWLEAGAGAVATQAWANTGFGPRGLALLREGRSAADVLATLLASDDGREHRQVGIVDAAGSCASHTGTACIPWAGGIAGDGFAAQGNCLAGPGVLDALAASFLASRGRLAERLVAAIAAAQAAGGDKRGQQSAALLLVKAKGGYGGYTDRYVDLRVDDAPEPIKELARLLKLHALYFFPAEPEDVLVVDAALGAELVALLHRVGVLARADGPFDEEARTALVSFMHVENLEERVRDDGTIDRQTLDYLREFKASTLAGGGVSRSIGDLDK
jgi:uncharacterized Ntn-hydrolase superfamily protein